MTKKQRVIWRWLISTTKLYSSKMKGINC